MYFPSQPSNRRPFTNGLSQAIRLRHLARRCRTFLASEDGPTAVEYAVMLALIVVVCLTAIQSVGTKASTTFSHVASSLSSAS